MSSLSRFSDFFYQEEDIGGTIKMSKQRHLWEFKIDGIYHNVEILHSRTSMKKILNVDGEIYFEENSYKNNFDIKFQFLKIPFQIVQTKSNKFELRIENKNFDILMIEERNKFKEEENNIQKNNNDLNFKNVKINKFEKVPSILRTRSSSYSKTESNNNVVKKNSYQNLSTAFD